MLAPWNRLLAEVRLVNVVGEKGESIVGGMMMSMEPEEFDDTEMTTEEFEQAISEGIDAAIMVPTSIVLSWSLDNGATAVHSMNGGSTAIIRESRPSTPTVKVA